MNGQNIKKYQQEELNLMCLTCKKTGKYIFSFAARQKPRKLNTQKWVNFWLKKTKQNRIQQNFHSFTVTDNIYENTRPYRWKTHVKNNLREEIR